MPAYVYIIASRRHGTIYTGVTTDLARRIYQHREGVMPGFSREHRVKRLVWFETFDHIRDAILREKQIKEWKRDWKVALIEPDNPHWDDLAVALFGFDPLPPYVPRRHPGESRDP